MELKGVFQTVGEIAGLAGICMIVFLSIAKAIVGKTAIVNQSQSFRLLRLLLWLAVIITAFGIVSWLLSLTIKERTAIQLKRIQLEMSNAATTQVIATFSNDRQDAILAGQSLNSMTVEWRFTSPPPWAKDLEALMIAASEDFFYSEDHLGALGEDYLWAIVESLRIDSGVNAAVVGVARGESNIASLFEGDTSAAIAIDRHEADTDTWASFDIKYVGPRFEVILPIASDWTAAISLGKKEDDVESPKVTGADSEALSREIENLTSHGFHATVGVDKAALIFKWEYGPVSLDRAMIRTMPNLKPSGLFPKAFNLAIVHEVIDGGSCITRLAPVFAEPKPAKLPDGVPDWCRSSELVIVVNGRADLAYRYKVTNCGQDEISRRVYENVYEYKHALTRFYCERL